MLRLAGLLMLMLLNGWFIEDTAMAEDGRTFIRVKDGKFVDTEGRQVLLHGVNISEKSPERGYLSWHGSDDFARMREWGFNCIRLSIFWDGIEPQPGTYDDDYLAGVDQRIQWAKQNGLVVLLDMHQDLYSNAFSGGGDGAPAWAVLDEGKPDVRIGPTWGMAYFTSRAIQTAFDNFWANTLAPDGIGLQDHFARAWQHIAKRYADEPAVLGYDLFNEPFPGSDIRPTLWLKMEAAAQKMAEKQGRELNIQSLFDMATQSEDLLGYLDDYDVYWAFMNAGVQRSQEFERTALASLYQRVAGAIREVDTNHILFLETHLLGNGGTRSGIVPILGADGAPDPLQAFAPHGYDLVTDTAGVANASEGRVQYIFWRHSGTAERLILPTLVGEWGAFYGNANALSAAQLVVRQLESHRFSDTYWSYGSRHEVDDAPYFPILVRPYPAAITGELTWIHSDLEQHTFHCQWREDADITAPSRIYLPEGWFTHGYHVHIEPEGEGAEFDPTSEGSASGYLLIPPIGGAERWLVVYPVDPQGEVHELQVFRKHLDERLSFCGGPEMVEMVDAIRVGMPPVCILAPHQFARFRRFANDVGKQLLDWLKKGNLGAACLLAAIHSQDALPLLREQLLTDRYFYGWEGPDYSQEERSHSSSSACSAVVQGSTVFWFCSLTELFRQSLKARGISRGGIHAYPTYHIHSGRGSLCSPGRSLHRSWWGIWHAGRIWIDYQGPDRLGYCGLGRR